MKIFGKAAKQQYDMFKAIPKGFIFVTKKVHQINASCRVEQLKYVPSRLNPADDADAEGQTSPSIHCPKFLWQQ